MKRPLILTGLLILGVSLAFSEQERWLKVRINQGSAKLEVNMPVSMARFAKEFLPEGARRQVDMKGIELDRVIAGLGRETDRVLEIDMGQNKVEFLLIPGSVVARPSSGQKQITGFKVKLQGKTGEEVIMRFPTALSELLPGFLPEPFQKQYEKIISQYLKEFPEQNKAGGSYDLIVAEDTGERTEVTLE